MISNPLKKLTPNRVIAAVIWSLGLIACRTFLKELGQGPTESWVWAVILQVPLTYLQHFLWHPRRIHVVDASGDQVYDKEGNEVIKLDRGRYGWLALVIDIAINFGGSWYLFGKLGDTSLMTSMYDMLKLDPTSTTYIPSAVRGVFSIIGAFVVAVAPEEIYRLDREGLEHGNNDGSRSVANAIADNPNPLDNDSATARRKSIRQ